MSLFAPLLLSQTETIPWIPLSKDAPDNIPGRKNAQLLLLLKLGCQYIPESYLASYYPASSTNESGEAVLTC